ncbi:hypothetical protein CSPAE12_01465 [Colletotrichum incanum]|nr:hypothetical protein CSPAE12_01465 [Colletotrichum incanum]
MVPTAKGYLVLVAHEEGKKQQKKNKDAAPGPAPSHHIHWSDSPVVVSSLPVQSSVKPVSHRSGQ